MRYIMQTGLERSHKEGALESAPALVLAYGVYLILAAIFVTTGRLVPTAIAWLAFFVVAVASSRFMTLAWSLYNGVAAALFFTSIIAKPFGELHLHTAGQWGATALLVASAVVSSHTIRSAMYSIRSVLTSKEEAWRT
jgi:hypothetical protein